MRCDDDQTWREMVDVAARLTAYHCVGVPRTVRAQRRHRLLWVIEGLGVADNWTDLLEPVRKRRVFGSVWKPMQDVQEAARHVEGFLWRDRIFGADHSDPGSRDL